MYITSAVDDMVKAFGDDFDAAMAATRRSADDIRALGIQFDNLIDALVNAESDWIQDAADRVDAFIAGMISQ